MNKLHKILTLSPFDESMDKMNTQAVMNPYRLFTVIAGLVLTLSGIVWFLISPSTNASTGFALYAMGASLKAVEVLIEWHLGLKAMAKNSLVLILFITFVIVMIRGI